VKVLVKLGGTLLDAPESRERLTREIADFASSGAQVVVVHGGGKQMTRFLAERNVESRFVNGLRVTSAEVLDAVLKVLGGTINHELVAALVAAGARAVGLSGLDGGTTVAELLDPGLGAVGKPVSSDGRLMNLLSANGYLPVVACIGGDAEGRLYNVNADQMAVACAAGFGAGRIFFLTDVDGVRLADGSTARRLSPGDIEHLIATGVATGGMQAKLESARRALEHGVGEVVIAPGQTPGIIARLAGGDSTTGTRVSEAAPHA
jgi:acetylglutamate kinase